MFKNLIFVSLLMHTSQILAGMLNQHPVGAPMERPADSSAVVSIFMMALEEATGKNFTQVVKYALSHHLCMYDTHESPRDDKAVILPGESSWGSDYGYDAP